MIQNISLQTKVCTRSVPEVPHENVVWKCPWRSRERRYFESESWEQDLYEAGNNDGG